MNKRKNYYKYYEEENNFIWIMIFIVIMGGVFIATVSYHMYKVSQLEKAYEQDLIEARQMEPIIPDRDDLGIRKKPFDGIEIESFKSFEDAQFAYLNAYLESNFETSFYIANKIMNQYEEGSLILTPKEKLQTQFQIYDSNLQLLIGNQYDYLYDDLSDKYAVIDFLLEEIAKYKDDKDALILINNDTYMKKVYDLAIQYSKSKGKKINLSA